MNTDTLIYGIRPVLEAFDAGRTIDKILFQSGLQGDLFREILKQARDQEIPYQFVPIQKIHRITTKNHQGVVAFISPVIYQTLENIVPQIYEDGLVPFLLVLDRITDVRNFGALVRTAESAGVQAVIVPSRGAAAIHEDAIKTSAGALLRMPIVRSPNLKHSLTYLRDSGIRISGVTEKTDRLFYDEDYTLPQALLLGSEEDGISPAYLPFCASMVKIPMMGSIESLNVSVAGGIVMFEVVTQRLRKPVP